MVNCRLGSVDWPEKRGHDRGTFLYHLPIVVPPPIKKTGKVMEFELMTHFQACRRHGILLRQNVGKCQTGNRNPKKMISFILTQRLDVIFLVIF